MKWLVLVWTSGVPCEWKLLRPKVDLVLRREGAGGWSWRCDSYRMSQYAGLPDDTPLELVQATVVRQFERRLTAELGRAVAELRRAEVVVGLPALTRTERCACGRVFAGMLGVCAQCWEQHKKREDDSGKQD